jgi:hypothetical protein
MKIKLIFLSYLMLTGTVLFSQQSQVIRYGYNPRGELKLIIEGLDTLISFYDAAGNRITESQNIYAIPDNDDPQGDRFLVCYPNPSGDVVTIGFELPSITDYQISLFNQSGQFLQTVADEKSVSGMREEKVSLGDLPSGVYYIWFRSREISKIFKIVAI